VAGQITNTFTYPALLQIVHEDRILFGPTGELRLGRHVALEVDALYKPIDNGGQFFSLVQLVGLSREPRMCRLIRGNCLYYSNGTQRFTTAIACSWPVDSPLETSLVSRMITALRRLGRDFQPQPLTPALLMGIS
jgi:hypothetical protein